MNFKSPDSAPKIKQESKIDPKVLLATERFIESLIKKPSASYAGGQKTQEDWLKVISDYPRLIMPGVSPEDILKGIQVKDLIIIPEPKKPEPEPEVFHETQRIQLSGVTSVEDPELQKILDENKFLETLEKDIFKNDKDLEDIYTRVLSLGKENAVDMFESDDYYFEFEHLVKGGREEIEKDLQSLKEIQQIFKDNMNALPERRAQSIEKAKKIATIVERAIVYHVSQLEWYGSSVNIEPTAPFDDVRRGVDDVLEIKKEDDSSFLGMGIDVTYRGLLSEEFKDKLFKLLDSIQNGYKTKIKYFKNHAGELMKEFAVPKTILFFDVDNVKDLVHMIKNIDDASVIEKAKNSPMKFDVMNQILIQTELLAKFAEESQNSIFNKYYDVVAAIKELSWKNPEVKKILDDRHDDEVTHHMKYLISEFKRLHPRDTQ